MEDSIHPLRVPQKAPYYKDNFGNDVQPIQLTFPIVRKAENNSWQVVGTGFFIHPSGGFVTARHCLYEGNKYDPNCYGIHTLSPGHHVVRKIQYFEAHPNADIGMGMLHGIVKDSQTHKETLRPFYVIAREKLVVGDNVITVGYPRMTINDQQEGYFPIDKYSGEVIEYQSTPTAWLKSPSYITNMEIKSGASGGPVLRANRVVGVNSTSFNNSDNEEPISFITPVEYLYDLTLTDSDGVRITVQQMMDAGFMPHAE